MANKNRFSPFIFLNGDLTPGGGNDSGDGSDHGGLDNPGGGSGGLAIGPVTFSQWAANFGYDANGNGSVDFQDYGQWWADNGLSMDAWRELNPNAVFTWSPDSDM